MYKAQPYTGQLLFIAVVYRQAGLCTDKYVSMQLLYSPVYYGMISEDLPAAILNHTTTDTLHTDI